MALLDRPKRQYVVRFTPGLHAMALALVPRIALLVGTLARWRQSLSVRPSMGGRAACRSALCCLLS
jgi:hypothetical protein